MRFLILFCVSIAIGLPWSSLRGAETAKRVLVVSTFHLSHNWTKAVYDAIAEQIAEGPEPAVVDYVELNSVRNRQGDFETKFSAYLPALQAGKYDLMVAILDDAIRLTLDHYAELPPDLPILFAGFRDLPDHFQATHPNISGFGGDYDMLETVMLGLALFPDTEEIAIITDDFPSGIRLHEEAQRQLAGFTACKLTFLNGRTYTTQQVLNIVSRMPEKSLVIFSPWRNFAKDGFTTLEQVAEELSRASSRSYLIMTEVLLGHGALGGYISEGRSQGEALVKLMQRVLAGEPVRDIPFQKVPTRCVVDMDVYDRLELPRRRLPVHAVLRNDQVPFYVAYPRESLLALVLFLVLFGSAGVIFTMWRRGKKRDKRQYEKLSEAHRQLAEYHSAQSAMIHSIGDGLLVVDCNECITMVNPVAARMTGYSAAEMIGVPLAKVFALVHQLTGSPLPSPTSQVLASGEIVFLPDYTDLVTRDGSRIHIADSAAPIRNPNGEITGAVLVFRDVTTEYRQKEDAAAMLNALTAATQLAKLSCAQIDLNGNSYVAGHKRSENWGYRNGHPLPVEEWVHPDDQATFLSEWNRLTQRQVDRIKISYRSSFQGEVRYFVMLVNQVDKIGVRDCPEYSCIIQDVSESGAKARELEDTNRLLHTLLELLPCPVIVKNAMNDYKFTLVNAKFCEMVGLPKEQLIGRSDFDVFPPETAERYRRDDSMAVEKRSVLSYVERMPGLNSDNYLHTMKTYVETGSGEILLLAVAVDITASEIAKQKAQDSEQLLRAIIDNAPVGLLLKDPDDGFRYLLWNAELGRYIGTDFYNVEGKNDYEWDGIPGRADHFRRQDEEVMATNTALQLEEKLSIAGGPPLIFQTAKIPLTLPSGKRYLLGSLVNVTAIRKMAEDLAQTVTSQTALLERERIYSEGLRIVSMAIDFDTAVTKLLELIGKHCGVDRCFVSCTLKSPGIFDRNVEWSADGVESQKALWRKFDMESVPELRRELLQNGAVHLNDFLDHPVIHQAFQAFAGAQFDLKSLALYAIYDENGFWGVAGLNTVKNLRRFSDADRELIDIGIRLFWIARESAMQRFRLDGEVHTREMILNNLEQPLLLFNPVGVLLAVNPAARAFAGLGDDDLLSQPCHEVICQCQTPPEHCPVWTVRKTGLPASCEMQSHGRDFLVSAKPIFTAEGDIAQILESRIDVTEINRNRRRLEEALKQSQAAEVAKDNFISTMNHELRTPLNAVIGFSELLQLGGLSETEQKEYLTSINASGKALMDLINDILEISKMESDTEENPSVQKTDIVKLFQDLSHIFKANAAQKKIGFELIMPSYLPALYVDPARLRQVIFNLVGNALKFTSLGSVTVLIQFETTSDEHGHLLIAVEDTGIGIRAEMQERIFEPFVQDDEVRGSRAYQGSGLGLAITRKLIESMRGTIRVVSCENIGSTFTVDLPHLRFEDAELARERLALPPGFNPKLLLVDDLPMNLKVLEAMVTKLGFESSSAVSGREALQLLETQTFDLILTDIWMPDMDGVQLAEIIRSTNDLTGSKICAITADAEWPGHHHTDLFDRIFYKPLKMEDLKHILAETLS